MITTSHEFHGFTFFFLSRQFSEILALKSLLVCMCAFQHIIFLTMVHLWVPNKQGRHYK